MYDTEWQDGLWLNLWDMGVKGRMLRVVNTNTVHHGYNDNSEVHQRDSHGSSSGDYVMHNAEQIHDLPL